MQFASALSKKASRIFDNACAKVQRGRHLDLLILDDYFPGILSAFRIAEYNYYLEKFHAAEVHSKRSSNRFCHSAGSYEEALSEYGSYYPGLKGKVRRYNRHRTVSCSLAYTIFLNNAYAFIDYIERHRLPLVFTLYPGGGFNLGHPETEMKLRRVLSSPSFRKVIVTQEVSERFLIENGYCRRDQVEFIYGVTLDTNQLTELPERPRFREEKQTFDICFVAAKYTPMGADKGYDTFIEVAKLLSRRYEDVRFHVVGPFDSTDIEVSEISDKITFYGFRNTDFFPRFYNSMDMVLSPNRPFVLAPGAFDGFPTGACLEAGLCGVALLCTDPLQQNIALKDGEEIVIIGNDPSDIVELVSGYHENPGRLYEIAARGKAAFERVFDLEAQMEKRVEILLENMNPAPSRERLGDGYKDRSTEELGLATS